MLERFLWEVYVVFLLIRSKACWAVRNESQRFEGIYEVSRSLIYIPSYLWAAVIYCGSYKRLLQFITLSANVLLSHEEALEQS